MSNGGTGMSEIASRPNFKNVLVVQLRQLGDILLTTPIAREIKRECPSTKVHFLAHGMGRLILEGSPYLDSIHYYHDQMTPGDWLTLTRNLRQLQCDLAIDFMDNPRSALLCWLSGASLRVGRPSWRRWAYHDTVARPTPGSYIVREKFQFLEKCGFHPQDPQLALPVTPPDENLARDFISTLPAHRPIVVLSPTHRRSNRQWSIANFAQLADALVAERNAIIVWIWGPGEEIVIDACMGLCHRQTYKAPATKFREMAALVKSANLVIANSNGPSHVAVAMDTPSLQLHGPTAGTAWCPNVARHQFIQGKERTNEAEFQAAVLRNDAPGQAHPMDTITVHEVLKKALEMLAR
jgi:heptosyltransferase III